MLEQLNNARGNDSLAEGVVQHGSVLVIERVDEGDLASPLAHLIACGANSAEVNALSRVRQRSIAALRSGVIGRSRYGSRAATGWPRR